LTDWKLVKAHGGGVRSGGRSGKASTVLAQLNNLQQDIDEKENVADKELQRLMELAAVWENWNRELVDPA
jgi:hypothetical protein